MNHSTIKAELVDLADSICRLAKIEPLHVIYNGMTSANGRAVYGTRIIKLSDSIFKEGEDYCWAVVIHEVCHFIHYDAYSSRHNWARLGKYEAHGNVFKKLETKWLAHYGMVPVYKRAYWKRLESMEGDILWTTWKERSVPVIPIPEDAEEYEWMDQNLFNKRRT